MCLARFTCIFQKDSKICVKEELSLNACFYKIINRFEHRSNIIVMINFMLLERVCLHANLALWFCDAANRQYLFASNMMKRAMFTQAMLYEHFKNLPRFGGINQNFHVVQTHVLQFNTFRQRDTEIESEREREKATHFRIIWQMKSELWYGSQ